MTLKKTHEQFLEEVFILVNNEYKVIGEYVNARTKIKMKHSFCDHEWNVLPDSFLNARSRCPKCAGVARKDTDIFKKEVYNLVGNEYEVLGEYKSSSAKIRIKHNNESCKNYEWDVVANSFTSTGARCPKCAGVLKKDTNNFKQEVFDLVGHEYGLLDEYKNIKTKIKLIHNNISCGYFEFRMIPSKFLIGQRCPKCSGSMKKTHDEFVKEVFEITKNEYCVIGEYINSSTKIMIRHKNDSCNNYEFNMKPQDFLGQNQRCPKCKESKGERIISNFLLGNNIQYVPQYKFDDCRNKNPLSFDFAIIKNNIPVFLIEFDGEQHFKPVDGWGGKKVFEKIQKRDKIKNDYCAKNNIPLIRVPFWEIDNIETILIDQLCK